MSQCHQYLCHSVTCNTITNHIHTFLWPLLAIWSDEEHGTSRYTQLLRNIDRLVLEKWAPAGSGQALAYNVKERASFPPQLFIYHTIYWSYCIRIYINASNDALLFWPLHFALRRWVEEGILAMEFSPRCCQKCPEGSPAHVVHQYCQWGPLEYTAQCTLVLARHQAVHKYISYRLFTTPAAGADHTSSRSGEVYYYYFISYRLWHEILAVRLWLVVSLYFIT